MGCWAEMNMNCIWYINIWVSMTLIALRETWMKTTWKIQVTPVRMSVMKKTKSNECWKRPAEQKWKSSGVRILSFLLFDLSIYEQAASLFCYQQNLVTPATIPFLSLNTPLQAWVTSRHLFGHGDKKSSMHANKVKLLPSSKDLSRKKVL